MRCISELSIERPGGQGARDRINVPCGRCAACLSNKRADWSLRIKKELRRAKSAHFITLTYSDPEVPFVDDTGYFIRTKDLLYVKGMFTRTLQKSDFQKFMKRLRHENKKEMQESIRYYAVGEYGTETDRPHYHAILYNVHPKVIDNLFSIWSHGLVHVGDVTPASIHYTTKYMIVNNHDDKKARQRPFLLCHDGHLSVMAI